MNFRTADTWLSPLEYVTLWYWLSLEYNSMSKSISYWLKSSGRLFDLPQIITIKICATIFSIMPLVISIRACRQDIGRIWVCYVCCSNKSSMKLKIRMWIPLSTVTCSESRTLRTIEADTITIRRTYPNTSINTGVAVCITCLAWSIIINPAIERTVNEIMTTTVLLHRFQYLSYLA